MCARVRRRGPARRLRLPCRCCNDCWVEQRRPSGERGNPQRGRARQPPAGASDRQVTGLVLVPTRELATQVGESFRNFSRYLPQPIKVLSVFGGISINPQMMALRGGADIV